MRAKNQKTFLRNVVLFHAILLGLLLIVTTAAEAKQSEWAVSDHVRARLLSGVKTVGEDSHIQAALEIDLADDWHTYWKHAGDSGLPMRFNWEGSENFKNAEILYPVPKRKNELGILTVFAYDGRLVLPMDIELENVKQDTKLNLEIQLMVCHEICIPDQLEVSLDLKAGKGAESAEIKLIEAAKRKVPYKQGEEPKNNDLYIDTIVTGADAIAVNAYMKRGSDNAQIIAHTEEFALTTKATYKADAEDERRVMITIPKPEDMEDMMQYLNGKTLTLVLSDGRNAVEKSISF